MDIYKFLINIPISGTLFTRNRTSCSLLSKTGDEGIGNSMNLELRGSVTISRSWACSGQWPRWTLRGARVWDLLLNAVILEGGLLKNSMPQVNVHPPRLPRQRAPTRGCKKGAQRSLRLVGSWTPQRMARTNGRSIDCLGVWIQKTKTKPKTTKKPKNCIFCTLEIPDYVNRCSEMDLTAGFF